VWRENYASRGRIKTDANPQVVARINSDDITSTRACIQNDATPQVRALET
jgi:hypothetical protein